MNNEYFYANYNDNPDPSHRPMYLKKTLKYLRSDKDIKSIIDVGCGGGDFSVGLQQAGYDIFGVDLSESGIRAAMDRNIGRFALSSGYDSLTEQFDVEHFDAAVCIEVIEHLYNPRQLILRVNQSLRPGGLLVITTPYWGYLKNIALAITNRTDLALTALWDGGHIKHFSRRTLIQLVTEQDFEFVGFKGCGEAVRAYTPFLWNGMLLCFRKKR